MGTPPLLIFTKFEQVVNKNTNQKSLSSAKTNEERKSLMNKFKQKAIEQASKKVEIFKKELEEVLPMRPFLAAPNAEHIMQSDTLNAAMQRERDQGLEHMNQILSFIDKIGTRQLDVKTDLDFLSSITKAAQDMINHLLKDQKSILETHEGMRKVDEYFKDFPGSDVLKAVKDNSPKFEEKMKEVFRGMVMTLREFIFAKNLLSNPRSV